MSFISGAQGKTYLAGYFLVDVEESLRLTREIPATLGTEDTENGGLYVKAGTIYPSNDEYAEGIVFEPVDVSEGNAAGSVVVAGKVVESRLPEALDSDAKTALVAAGIVFVDEDDTVTRPEDEE